jgi:hypothetical protein
MFSLSRRLFERACAHNTRPAIRVPFFHVNPVTPFKVLAEERGAGNVQRAHAILEDGKWSDRVFRYATTSRSQNVPIAFEKKNIILTTFAQSEYKICKIEKAAIRATQTGSHYGRSLKRVEHESAVQPTEHVSSADNLFCSCYHDLHCIANTGNNGLRHNQRRNAFKRYEFCTDGWPNNIDYLP